MGSRVADWFWILMFFCLLGYIGEMDREDAEAVRQAGMLSHGATIYAAHCDAASLPGDPPRIVGR